VTHVTLCRLRKRVLGHLEGTIPVLSATGAGRPQLAEPAPAVVHGGLVGEHSEQHEALAVLEGDGEEAHLHEAASELVAREQRRLRWVRRVQRVQQVWQVWQVWHGRGEQVIGDRACQAVLGELRMRRRLQKDLTRGLPCGTPGGGDGGRVGEILILIRILNPKS